MRFTLRDLFWLTLCVAVGLGVIVWYDHVQSPAYKAQIKAIKSQNERLWAENTGLREMNLDRARAYDAIHGPPEAATGQVRTQ